MLVRERNIKYIKSNIRFRWPCYYMILKNKIKKIKLFHKRYKNKKIFYNLFVARSYNHNLRLRSHKFKLPRRRLFRINYRRRFLRKKLKIKKKKFSSKAINNKSLRFSYWKFHAYTSRRRRKLKKKSKFLKKWVFKKKKINKLFKSYIFKRRKYKFKRYYSYAMLALNNKINSLKTYRLFKNYIFNFTRYYSKLFKFDYANQLKWRFSRSKFNYFAFVQKIKNLYLFINSNIISAGSSFTSLDKSFINKFKKKFKLSKFMYFNKKIRIRRKRLFYNLKKLFSNKLFSNEFNKKLIFNKKFIKPLFKKKIVKYYKARRLKLSFIKIISKKLMKFADISGLHNHFFILLEKYLILKPYFNVTAVSNFLAACSVFFKSYRNYYYNCYIKRSTNNFFITITNMLGEVFFAFSAGRLESFRNKKKRRNAAVLPYIFQHISLILHRQFAITKIKHLFVSLRIRQAKRIYWLLRRRGFKINKLINILPRTHSNTLYKKFKKLRRV